MTSEPKLTTPPARPEFDLDRTLEKALKGMLEADEAVSRAAAGGALEAFEKASKEFDVKEAAYERALAAKGWRPPWPPKTAEGRAIWGVTETEVEEWRGRQPQ
jgi:hypothetical protein